ncbi:MAG: hypothetical protein KAS23_13845, partial [Anaerohalosphaera sp.]|nr:hypothetical protein [Anaerohalosphaera sp.]
YIGDELIVDNDGMHAPVMKSGSAALKAGTHPIRIEFVQGEGGIMLDAYFTPPGENSQKVPPKILFHQP